MIQFCGTNKTKGKIVVGLMDISRFFSTHPLTRDAPIKAWGRFLSWQIKSRLQDEIVVPWIGGQRLAVRGAMTGATGNIYVGLQEFADMMFLLHFLRKGDLFLDIGANVGTYTVLASGVCRARTWAFEPDVEAAAALRRNIEINDLEPLATIHNYALGATNDVVAFTTGLGPMNRRALAGEQNARMTLQKTLDTIIDDQQPLLAKVDVEGYEDEVFRGAARLLATSSISALLIETVTNSLAKTLNGSGFCRLYYDPFTRTLAEQPKGAPAANHLFVKDIKALALRLSTARPVLVLGRFI
jgi:FkbM family methyltransferase